MLVRTVAALLLLCMALPVSAEPIVIRMATIAPDGSSWSRDAKAFAREVAAETGGAVQIKWYWGAIAGDERRALARVRAGQLDGVGGVMTCQMLSRSLHVTRLLGLFRSRDEGRHIYSRLLNDVRAEFVANGYRGIAFAAFDFDLFFSRRPLRSMADLRASNVWMWDLDEVWKQELPLLGVHATPLPVEAVAHAWDAGEIDVLPALPTAALAFQWSAQARYWVDMPLAFMPACVAITNRVYDELSLEQRAVIDAAGARLSHRFDNSAIQLDDALLGGLFEKQGLVRIQPSPAFRQEFFDAAARVRAQMPDSTVPRAQLDKVEKWLADFRAANKK